jgi:hypothetical protein
LLSRSRLAFGGRLLADMLNAKRIITAIMGVVGVLLIVRGAWGGVWPLSVQLIAGVGLVVYAILRWRYTL